MPFYLYQASYSADAIKAMIAEPQNREEVAAKLIESLGGTLHHFSFAFGTFDAVALIELPDDKAMVAGSMIVAATGTITGGSTTKLVPMKDAMEAMAMAGQSGAGYRPATG